MAKKKIEEEVVVEVAPVVQEEYERPSEKERRLLREEMARQEHARR